METTTNTYLLLFRDAGADRYRALTADERQQLLQQWRDWYDGLAAAGKLQGGHPLESETRLVSGPRGERVIDGPFAEAKEAIGGYFLLTVFGLEEATAIARQCPSLPLGLTVEVRAVAGVCPVLRASREAVAGTAARRTAEPAVA